jgi:hypothetical protein
MSISHLVRPIAVLLLMSTAALPSAVRSAAEEQSRTAVSGQCFVVTVTVKGTTDTITICPSDLAAAAARRGRQLSRW